MGDFGLKLDETQKKPEVAKDLLAGMKPRASSRSNVDLAESDRNAVSAGFRSRESVPAVFSDPGNYMTPRRRKREPEPTTPLSMRPPRSVHARFRDYADGLKISYPEALEKLLDESETLARLQQRD
jgi:hypothetical protein